jgi:hypothetical protein
MLAQKSAATATASSQTNSVYTFVKEGSQWFIDLPEYLAQGGSKADLQMVEGADELLQFIAGGKKRITLQLDREPFEDADVLELVELCAAPMGGGYYRMHMYRNQRIEKRIWLCDVTLFVFGDMPEHIYFRKIGAKADESVH